VRIRQALPSDDPQLRALDQATWSPEMSPAPPPPAEQPFFGPGCAPEDVLVAVLDDAIAGYVRLGHPTSLAANRHVVEMRGLAVDPNRRGQGLGRAVLSAAAAEATERGARRLTLRVLAPNIAARALYERCGFELEGVLREEFLLDGRYVDDVLMALELGPREE
jgi:RimJ/RimL family protein N-acetyltransferase